MIQNSLERLLEGIAAALRDDVAPALDDAYARSQALAGAELIENLVGRVEWRCADLVAVVEGVRPLLAEAAELAPAGASGLEAARRVLAEEPPGGDNAALLRTRDAHLRALAGVQDWLAEAGTEADPLREHARAAIGAQLGDELDRLRAARRLGRRGS
jgi:hypothetical protein